MSVVVIGMEMPSCCSECEMNYDCLGCSAIRYDSAFDRLGFDMDTERLPDCPLRPLPEKHGRLIDAEALLARFPEPNHENGGWLNPEEAWIHKTGVWAKIRSAPTIVEAEGD